MFDFESWKNEIVDHIKDLHEETKLIREQLEEDASEDFEDHEDQKIEEIENAFNDHDLEDQQEEQDDQDDQDEQEEQVDQDDQDDQEEQDVQEVIIQKLDDINDSINILNKTVVESSIVISISIILALAFHYFINQLSKW